MMLTSEIKLLIERSVLCWLATADEHGIPNVSPKEMFAILDDEHLIIAQIASPKSVANLKVNPRVCLAFIDIFVQKGYQIKGKATILKQGDALYEQSTKILVDKFSGKFPFKQVICMTIESCDPIIAPSYRLFAQTTEQEQVASAMETYGVKPGERFRR